MKNWRQRPNLIPARPQIPPPLEWFKCNQPGCGKTFTNLRDLAGHKRGHSGLPPTEDVSLLPSSMGGGWNP